MAMSVLFGTFSCTKRHCHVIEAEYQPISAPLASTSKLSIGVTSSHANSFVAHLPVSRACSDTAFLLCIINYYKQQK